MIADTLVTGFDVADLFDRLTTASVQLLGAATVGLMLADRDGLLQLMMSSSADMRDLEPMELVHREGHGVDCCATRRAVAIGSRAARRQPRAWSLRPTVPRTRCTPCLLDN